MPSALQRACARTPSWLALLLLLLATACGTRVQQVPVLRFSAPEGAVLNEFFRQGSAAAHLVLTPGLAPRVVMAFPAGNSGVAIWFEAEAALIWQPAITMQAVERRADGGTWHGVSAELGARGGRLRIRQALLGSVRVLRSYADTAVAPAELVTAPRVSGRQLVWQRRRLDGAPGYYLALEVLGGGRVDALSRSKDALELAPDADGSLRLRVTALTAEPPLTPLDPARIVTARARPDTQLRRMLEFLSYREKLLAGSWRFNSYFGRDTLVSLLLLAPVAQPELMEAGLSAVLERLNESGEVAHEEDVGEYALLRRRQAGLPASAAPLLDYTMVDDDFMLALVAARYLRDAPARASTFLAQRTSAGASLGARLVRNLRFVVESAAPFARAPEWPHLVSLKDGTRAGNWRDSDDGLGGGRYAYDVNAVLVPAALEAVVRLAQSSALRPYLDGVSERALAPAAAFAAVWKREAPARFDVVVPAVSARLAVQGYAERAGVAAAPALAALDTEPVRFHAVSLDASGRPVPVLHSDEALALLLLEPASGDVQRVVETLARPFPAGLMTDVGLLVANPAYAPGELSARFDRTRYHGTVIWGWQQALLAAALTHQLGRADLGASARASLLQLRARLRSALAATHALRGSELWSWSQANARYRIEPFGQRAQDETESNAAQLWSTIQLAPE